MVNYASLCFQIYYVLRLNFAIAVPAFVVAGKMYYSVMCEISTYLQKNRKKYKYKGLWMVHVIYMLFSLSIFCNSNVISLH